MINQVKSMLQLAQAADRHPTLITRVLIPQYPVSQGGPIPNMFGQVALMQCLTKGKGKGKRKKKITHPLREKSKTRQISPGITSQAPSISNS
jgi:hypothetical protein